MFVVLANPSRVVECIKVLQVVDKVLVTPKQGECFTVDTCDWLGSSDENPWKQPE